MATKRVKKFGRGGDILTALGAGLAGYGAYKHFTKDEDKDDIRSDGRSSGLTRRPDVSETKAEPVSVAKKEPAPAPVVDTTEKDEVKPAPTPKRNKTAPKGNKIPIDTEESAPRAKATDKVGTGYEGLTTVPKPAPAPKKIAKKPGDVTFLTKERSEAATKSVGRGWREQNPNLSKSQAEKFKDYQKNNSDYQKMLEGFKNKKAGGTVKKYAAGGSVSSASKRADGIAMRGKTRGKVY